MMAKISRGFAEACEYPVCVWDFRAVGCALPAVMESISAEVISTNLFKSFLLSANR